VQLNKGDFANFSVILKSPKIFEQGAYLRSWRLLANKNIYLLNEQGETLNYQIKDISASGISLLINDENKDNFPEKLNNIYLQLPNNERLAISATKIRRVDDKTVAYLLKSTIDDRVLTLLVEYLFECHAEKYPEVHQKQKRLMLI
jgi:c-di-GMP-binding flagellar brake protein YcgR